MRGSTTSKNPLAVILTLFFLAESSIGAIDAHCETPASESKRPFDTVTLTVHAVHNAALGSFTDLWEPSAGLRVDLAAPVYAGIAQAGIHFFDHRAQSPTVPDFGCVDVWLGWAYRWDLHRRVSCAAGIETGVSYMMFDDESTARACEEETEVGFGINSQAAYAWNERWSFVLTGGYRKILTKHPVEYVFVGAGVGRTFAAPSWLREFLE